VARYGGGAKKAVKSAMHRRKSGTLRSGSGNRVRSRKQAIAIGLSEAREKGAKVPRKSKIGQTRDAPVPHGFQRSAGARTFVCLISRRLAGPALAVTLPARAWS
jgi:hypothetical protein